MISRIFLNRGMESVCSRDLLKFSFSFRVTRSVFSCMVFVSEGGTSGHVLPVIEEDEDEGWIAPVPKRYHCMYVCMYVCMCVSAEMH